MNRTTARHLGALLLPALLLAGVSSAPAQDGAVRIAVVDIERVVSESTVGLELQRKLDTFSQSAEQELKQRASELQDLQTRVNNEADPAERARLAKQYEDGRIGFQRLQDDKQREGQKVQRDGLAEIEKALAPVFRQIQDEQGWDLILARTPGLTLVVSQRVDLTAEILERFNAVSP